MFKPEYEGSFDDLGSKIGSGVDCDLCKVVSLSSAMANHIRTELKCTKINYFKHDGMLSNSTFPSMPKK